MAGYTRQSSYSDGDTITAAHSNDEFNQVLSAFNNSTGHKHDGTAAEGPVIGLIGDPGVTTPLNKVVVDNTNNRVGVFVDAGGAGSTVEQVRFQDGAIVPVTSNDVDLGTSSVEFKDAFFDGTVTTDALVADTANIDGGSVDGITLGTNSAVTQAVIDNININGATIGHTSDTDLMTLASGIVTVAGEVSMTTLDIGGTNITSTAAELNILDGNTSSSSVTVVDADQLILNDSGTMKQITAADLKTYTGGAITSVGAVDSGSITSGFGNIDTGSSTITTTGAITGGSVTADDVALDGKVITLTGSTGDTATLTAGTNGTLDIATTDADAAAANITITADGTAELAGTTVTLNSSGGVVLDADGGTITFSDGGSSLGTVTSSGFTGNVVGNVTGNINGNLTGTLQTAAQTNVTSVGALDGGSITSNFGNINNGSSTITTTGAITGGSVTADDVAIDGKVITLTGSTDDTATITAGTNGTLAITTTDTAAAAANISITADGTAELAGTTVTLNSSGGVTLDADGGTITFADGGASLGTVTSDGFTGNVVGNVTGNINGNLTGTLQTAAQTNITSVGALDGGSITSGFGAINNGASAITTTGVITGGTVEATGDTSAGDNAAIGFTAAEGLILTGQGSSTDVTIKNDADGTVASIATGTTVFTMNDDVTVVGRAVGSTITAENDATYDLAVGNNFTTTTSGDVTLTFSNVAAGQSGCIKFVNDSNRSVSADTPVAINASVLTSLSTTGTYFLTYYVTAASGANTILVGATAILT